MIEDTTDGSIKIISYIGGDAYTAPIAYIKQTGSNAIDEYHYLHRDYLGSILAITDSSGAVKEQRQFGAWGQADKFVDSDGNTTFTHSSLIGRGYTGHEHFFEVNLIHMNGRMYDANLGRFLSPDNYIQDPFNTQSFNRYGYVQNNPLINVDYSGESFWRSIGKWIKKHAKVITLVATIAVAVVATVATAGMASPLLAGAIVGFSAGFTAGAVGTWTNGGDFLSGLGNGFVQGAIGAVAGAVGAGVGQWAANNIGAVVVNGLKISSPVLKGVVGGAIGGAAGGYAGSFAAGAISTGSLKGAHQAGMQGLVGGALIGGLAGGGAAYRAAKDQGVNPWSGKSIEGVHKGVNSPRGWVTKSSNKGGGVKFVDPQNPHNQIRQMPGNPNSPNIYQQKPYIKFMKNGRFYDVNGNILPNGNIPQSHIPLNEFDLRRMPKF